MTTNPGVPTPDVLAVERFRTVLFDTVDPLADEIYEGGASLDVDNTAAQILKHFPSAQFVHDVNSAGVPVRRLVVHGEWEVDPSPPKPLPPVCQHGLLRMGCDDCPQSDPDHTPEWAQ